MQLNSCMASNKVKTKKNSSNLVTFTKLRRCSKICRITETSPKGFSASKCDVGNWIFSKSYEFFEILSGFFFDIWRIFRIFFGFFWNFWEDFLEGILCLHCYLNMKGIDLFVKILVFVKILSQWRRKEEGKTRNLDP